MQYGFKKEQSRIEFYFKQFRKIHNSVVFLFGISFHDVSY